MLPRTQITRLKPIIYYLFFILTIVPDQLYANDKPTTTTLNPVIVTASKSQQTPTNYAGSFYKISPEDINKKQSNDINRILRDVPSINLQEEDGYGIRPNIGIRGSRNDRSTDIVIMEDNVLIAPAPYAAPAAYYFPAVGRTSAIEVYKGTSAIKYGPRTTSGALNIITKPIPESAQANLTTSVGSYNEKNATFTIGNAFDHFGYVLNFDHKSSDGFKKLDRGGDIGFSINDVLSKFRFNNDKDDDIYHEVEFKLGYSEEDSSESYIGLDAGDFVSDPYRRYYASKLDAMQTQHSQYQVSHNMEFDEDFAIKTTAYYHAFDRTWYRLDRVDDDTTDGTSSKKVNGIFSNGLSSYIDIIKGNVSSYANHELDIKANNRSFVSQGIQSTAHQKFNLFNSQHTLEYGFRLHDDHEDRFQRADKYKIIDGSLVMTSRGTDGTGNGNNRIGTVRAYSAFAQDTISWNKWSFTPGIRFEHIEIKQRNFGSSDPTRSSPPNLVKNNEDVLIPGLGTSYKFSENVAAFANIHKGFGPPAPGSSADAEESVNYEAGLRYNGKNNLFLENTFFLNNYSNLTTSDIDGNEVNGGKVQSYGLEMIAGYNINKDINGRQITFPLKATYSYNHSEFKSSFDASDTIDEWGVVTKGDRLPYVSPHQFSIALGMETKKISFNLNTKYVDAMRTNASRGKIEKGNKIPSHFIADLSMFYKLNKKVTLFSAIDNIFDRKYAVSSRPAGLRPGKPLTARIGVQVGF